MVIGVIDVDFDAIFCWHSLGVRPLGMV